MRKLWILLLILFGIVFSLAVACAYSDDFKIWFGTTILSMTGQFGVAIADWWSGVSVNPIYQQWHMLIWFAGGMIGMFLIMKAWAKRPSILQKATGISSATTAMNLQKEPAEPEIAPAITEKETSSSEE